MATIPYVPVELNDQQRAIYYAQINAVQKDEVVGILLALFLGVFGAHHFYLRRNGLGILYVLFCWSGIPAIAGFVECFFMPGRVRQYNVEQAVLLAANLRYAMPGAPAPQTPILVNCASCGMPLPEGVKFCARCGAAVMG